MASVLIIEDDVQISKSLSIHLGLEGHQVQSAENIELARNTLSQYKFDILLMDVNLPDGNGLDFCHELVQGGFLTPILFLSANIDEESVVRAMQNGAEDYIRKPFGIAELSARMSRILKTHLAKNIVDKNLLTFDKLQVNLAKRVVLYSGQELILPRKEFDIFAALVKRKGDVLTRENIIEVTGGGEEIYDRTIDSHISHLRRKMKSLFAEDLLINPVYGVGYKLEWKKS